MNQFEEIWYEYYPKLSIYLQTSFHFSETDDLIQEIMIKVHTNLHKYRPAWALSTWIYSIAHNHAVDELKKETSRLKVLESVKQATAILAGAAPADKPLLLNELKNDITIFIDSLPEAERQVSFLKYHEEMNYREICRVTGIPVGTIKYHIHNVKQKFSAYYGEHYEN